MFKKKITIELPKNEAELLLEALNLLPKNKRTIVYEKLHANIQNVVTLYMNAERVEMIKKRQDELKSKIRR
jgi:predicted DNA-binding protein